MRGSWPARRSGRFHRRLATAGSSENWQVPAYAGAVNPLFASIAATLSRTLARHQGRPPRDARRLPLWRLLLDEVVYLVGRAVRPPWVWVWVSAGTVATVVMVAFADATPGPVIPFGWRAAAAVAAAAITGAAIRRWPGRRGG